MTASPHTIDGIDEGADPWLVCACGMLITAPTPALLSEAYQQHRAELRLARTTVGETIGRRLGATGAVGSRPRRTDPA